MGMERTEGGWQQRREEGLVWKGQAAMDRSRAEGSREECYWKGSIGAEGTG